MPHSRSPNSFPDKERDPNAQGAFGLVKNAIPTTMAGDQILTRRLKSISGYSCSSSEDGSPSFRRMTSFGSATDSSKSIKCAVRTPKPTDRREQDPFYTHEVLMEMTREAHNAHTEEISEGSRPPSPRPNTPRQRFIEHNKQLHVWDDWVTLNSARESDFAAIMYKRSLARTTPRSFQKFAKAGDSFEDIDHLGGTKE